MYCDNILQAVGNTPLVKLNRITAFDGTARLYGKCEFVEPGGSIKDRTALNLIRTAQRDGLIEPGGVIIEPTSGNTGIGLAMAGAVLGYKVILTMPDNMSEERRKVLRGYGAEIMLTPACDGMKGAISKAEELQRTTGGFIPSQFDNPANSEAHYISTAGEIISDLPDVSAIVVGIGTGGTAMGIADYIRAKGLDVAVYGVEPTTSAVLSGQKAGSHGLQGIGAGFVPSILDPAKLSGVITVSDGEAYEYSRRLMREEGMAVGISAGAAVVGAVKISKTQKGKIVAVLPDTGMRYLSTELYE